MRLVLTAKGSANDRHSSRTAWFLATLSAVIQILTPVGSVIAIFLTGSTVPAIILAVYLSLLTTAVLILLIKQERRHQEQVLEQERQHRQQQSELERRHHDQLVEQDLRSGRASRYAPATGPLRKAFGCLGNAAWTVVEGDGSEENFIRHLRDALQFLAEAFSLVTEQPCRTAIKMTSAPFEGTHIRDVLVYTLCRSDEGESYEPLEHNRNGDRIGDNTDFRQILEGNAQSYFCNDLPAELSNGYQNSHWDQTTIKSGAFKYRATIVWPIARARPLGTQNLGRREIIGFLCVDTPVAGSFHETYDVPIGTAFCGVLHLALHRFRARQMGNATFTGNQKPQQ